MCSPQTFPFLLPLPRVLCPQLHIPICAGHGELSPKAFTSGKIKIFLFSSSLPPPRLVREFVAQNNTSQIKHVIQILSQEFALSQHPHSRKGGLIGLAACSIALGKVRASVSWLLHTAEGQKPLHVPR